MLQPKIPQDQQQAERLALGDRIDRLRRSKGLTLAELALKVGYDERTIRNALAGKSVKERTLRHICEAVGLVDNSAHFELAEFSDVNHGGYCNKTTQIYCGQYQAYRWSYNNDRRIVRSVYNMAWCHEKKVMIFDEHQRYIDKDGRKVNFTQQGEFYSSDKTGFIHLVTISEGMVRLVTLTKLDDRPVLRGAVLTQARMSFYRQAAISPLLLHKMPSPVDEADFSMLMGELSPGDGGYAGLAAELKEIEREVVLSMFAPKVSNFSNGVQPFPVSAEEDALQLQPN